MKGAASHLVIGVVSLAVVCALAEGAARLHEAVRPVRWTLPTVKRLDNLVGAGREATMFRPDETLMWTLKPNYRGRRNFLTSLSPPAGDGRSYEIATNAHGFRGAEFDADAARRRFLILCLGDSTTFGLNAEQGRSYPDRLQELLETRRPGDFLVWNGGVPGYTSVQGEALLERMPFPAAPDLLLVGYGHNDSPRYRSHFVRMRAALAHAGESPLEALRRGLDHSAAFRAHAKLLLSARDRLRPGVSVPTLDSYRGILRRAEALPAATWLLAMNGLPPEVDAAIRTAAAESNRPLVDFRDLFAENGGDALMSEEIHPNEAGYALMAEVLARDVLALAPAARRAGP